MEDVVADRQVMLQAEGREDYTVPHRKGKAQFFGIWKCKSSDLTRAFTCKCLLNDKNNWDQLLDVMFLLNWRTFLDRHLSRVWRLYSSWCDGRGGITRQWGVGIIHVGGLKNNTIIKSGYLKLAEIRWEQDITLALIMNTRFGLITHLTLPV